MTAEMKYARGSATCPGPRIGSGAGCRAGIPAAALAALLLAGCSSGHIGDDWQCPLAAGGSCSSVAAADPAVPKTDVAPARTPGQPIRLLPREWDADLKDRTDQTAASAAAIRACETECSFDPFAWLARLFEGGEDKEEVPRGPVRLPPDTAEIPVGAGPRDVPAAADRETTPALPVADIAAEDDEGEDTLRTGETVARIWIAPFVDGDGVYREASHVRVVLEPAGWRLR